MQATTETREQRRATILKLIQARRIKSQAELRLALADHDLPANQATLSRDLRDMGVVKGRDGYELPATPQSALASAATPALVLRNAVREWMQRVVPTQNLLVLRTPPSGASPLAHAIDQSGDPNVLGTVAGDDTVLVIAKSAGAARRLAKTLEGLVTRA